MLFSKDSLTEVDFSAFFIGYMPETAPNSLYVHMLIKKILRVSLFSNSGILI